MKNELHVAIYRKTARVGQTQVQNEAAIGSVILRTLCKLQWKYRSEIAGENKMFCPNCGLENAKGQKFCRRCGVNLMALDLAQNFINEVATGKAANQAEPNNILKITALISILGFLFITIGVILVTLMQHEYHQGGPPIGLFLAIFGYGAIVLICRRLLKLLETPRTETKPFVVQPTMQAPALPYSPTSLPSQTNRNLGAAPIYHSITEQETQQFQHEQRTNS